MKTGRALRFVHGPKPAAQPECRQGKHLYRGAAAVQAVLDAHAGARAPAAKENTQPRGAAGEPGGKPVLRTRSDVSDASSLIPAQRQELQEQARATHARAVAILRAQRRGLCCRSRDVIRGRSTHCYGCAANAMNGTGTEQGAAHHHTCSNVLHRLCCECDVRRAAWGAGLIDQASAMKLH